MHRRRRYYWLFVLQLALLALICTACAAPAITRYARVVEKLGPIAPECQEPNAAPAE